jgi:hypothetical protein
LSKFHPNLKIPRRNSFKFKLRKFSEFLFEIYFESEEVPMEKVVPLFKPFTAKFYFKIFELGRYFLDRPKFGGF